MKTLKETLHWLSIVSLVMLSACGGGGGNGNNPGPPGTIQLAGTSFDGSEGTVVNMIVTRSGGNSGIATVDYTITDGIAVAGSDYSAVNGALSGTFTYADQAAANRTISIRITDDNTAEGPESFTVTLSNVSGATPGPNLEATVNIIDNDTAALSAFGPITELNSATVNGIRYNTDATNVDINGLPANVSDLKLGQLVAIEGDVNFSNARGTANQIDYSATVIGPVENIDSTLDRLLVMGQTVVANADTVFDPSIDPDSFAGLTVGTTTQISGFLNADGEIIATRIEPDSTSIGVQLVGTVSRLDLANMLFWVSGQPVDYRNAILMDDLPAGEPTDGLLVIVRGSLDNGILLVDEIASIINFPATPGERVHLGGIVTRFASATDFDLNGFPMTTNASSVFEKGVAGDLEANVEITVEGEVGAGGDAIVANQVTIGRPVDDRSTETFDFENFTNLSVLGLSKVTVEQGPNFSVEVTAPSVLSGDLLVTQDGDTVTFGDNNSLFFLDAFVTMPVLNRLDVEAGSLANVTLRDFNQTEMNVNVGGVSRLRAEGLQIVDLTATVSGVSLLDFGDIRPIGNANVDVGGVSQATLNMEAGSTLAGSVSTGQGTGNSTLFYYGTDVTENVTLLDSPSRVTRLGDTKP